MSIQNELTTVPLGIIAGGKGVRLTNGASSKPLYEIRGKALIDYVMDAALKAGIQEVFVLVRKDDQELISHLNNTHTLIRDLRIIFSEAVGTGHASTQLMDIIGERAQLLTTSDIICEPEDLLNLMSHAQTTLDERKDLSLLALTRIHGSDNPIWVEVDENLTVIRYGKTIPPQTYSWGNIRYCTTRFCQAASAYRKIPGLRDTVMCSELVERFPRAFHGFPMPHIFDVDTPADAQWASATSRQR